MYSLSDPVATAQIITLLEQGKSVACATESVWGISCDYDNPHAVASILKQKKRQPDKGLILVTGQRHHLNFIIDALPQQLQSAINNYWPGFATLLIPDVHSRIPQWAKGSFDKVAIRLTEHPQLCQLSKLWGNLIVSTSANIEGHPPALTPNQVTKYFSDDIAIITSSIGNKPSPSPIIDLETGIRIR